MATGRDYRSIVYSPPFTFLVGPQHTKLTVQSGLAQHVSQPLDHLMNGQTRESKHHIAVLEEEDVETFVAFCEYAYTGDYTVPPPGSREEELEIPVVSNSFDSHTGVPPFVPSPPNSGGFSDRGGDDWAGEEFDPGQYPSQTVEAEATTGQYDLTTENPEPTGEAPEDPATATVESAEQQHPTAESDPQDKNDDARGPQNQVKTSKKNKKNKKKQKGGASAEDPGSNLTPPTTPPPEKPKEGFEGQPPTAETAEVSDEWERLTGAPGAADPEESAQPTDVAEPEDLEQSAPIPPEDDTAAHPQQEGDEGEWNEQTQEETGRDVKGPTRPPTRSFIDSSFVRQDFSNRHETGISLWDEFATIDYVDPRKFSTRPPSSFSGHLQPSGSDLPYLLFHAKLYVFATRYLIPALAQLCLRKLHRDLVYLGFPESATDRSDPEQMILTNTKARMVLDLLHYAYTKTTRLEPISPTSATQLRDNELRRLVIHYAACKVRDLAEFCPPLEREMGYTWTGFEKPSARGLRGLLDTTTELASDLVYRMM
ncbi:uncharacterized protein BDW47DRAFT_84008 [Aspergillus candidus]|uniref:BTB domain-containing protein n=1 Tax=Aspergillus candidus TaxID=41067 RepID=A0A2I2F0A4_ASPCN|nr:hypothetical protein BDW47DRAFT_84008 [Aspergillus candidus]PLB34048.1 hypothetical protein BDW47DRAFT_84008 [Aspergillus candidus]